MPVRQLTAAFVQQATCPAGAKKIEYRDTTIIGFSLEVRASGGKTWYQRYFTPEGRQRQFKIGGVNDITFDQARKRAKELRAETVLGGDPVAKKEERKAIPAYAKLAEQHLAEAKAYQKSWWSVESILRLHILPRWGKHRLNEIKPQEVAKWLGEKAAEGLKPATVEKIRAVLHRSYELARRWNLPGGESNPVHGLPRPRYSNARQRYLTAFEIQRLRGACEESSNSQLKHIVGLLLLTGARKSELLQAKWEHVDFERRLWFIPQTKNGRSRHVPLSTPALAILRQLPRLPGCDYVLPNLDTGRPFVTLKKAWQTARHQAGLGDLRLHDLRHSAASLMINAGVDLYAVGRVLGHTDHKSTMRYSHLANETLFNAVEAAANKQTGWTALSS
jgi:integrase